MGGMMKEVPDKFFAAELIKLRCKLSKIQNLEFPAFGEVVLIKIKKTQV
jgi:hypothetical protein